MKSKSSRKNARESPCCSLKDLEVHTGGYGQDQIYNYTVTTTRSTPYPRIMPKPRQNDNSNLDRNNLPFNNPASGFMCNSKSYLSLDSWTSVSCSSSSSSNKSFEEESSSSISDNHSDISSPTSSTFSIQSLPPLFQKFKGEKRGEVKAVEAVRNERMFEGGKIEVEHELERELPDAEDFEVFVEALFGAFPNVA